MKGFAPGLFDRLLGWPQRPGAHAAHGSSAAPRLSAEEMKDAVARDLEALLNTRAVLPADQLAPFPACRASLVGYGMRDFADLSLSSPTDRLHICACIEAAIACHEPRLRNVKAALELRAGAINRLNFSITGLLVSQAACESVNFDAILQASTLSYSISKTGRAARPGA
jgi:type VI secretion system protein ImpF